LLLALFTITKLYNQPRCPTISEWRKKMQYIHTMECYSAIKKNEIMSFAEKWMGLEIIKLSEISQFRKKQPHIFTHTWNIDLK
jgi:hypothetical protein